MAIVAAGTITPLNTGSQPNAVQPAPPPPPPPPAIATAQIGAQPLNVSGPRGTIVNTIT
jgi:hypothetical protein